MKTTLVSKKMKSLLTLAGLGLILTACAHEPNKSTYVEVDKKAAKETEVKSPGDLTKEASHLIEHSSLSEAQKTKLGDLRKKMQGESAAYRSESLHLRSLLIHEVLSDEYNSKEVLAIEKKLKSLEEKRLQNMFSGVQAANDIIGRVNERKTLMQDMMDFQEQQMRIDQ